jgi:hypothetical protein
MRLCEFCDGKVDDVSNKCTGCGAQQSTQPASTIPVVPAAPTPQSKADEQAKLSMILGICSILASVITGIPAIILGFLALSDASEKGKNQAKIGIGIGGFMTLCLIFFIIPDELMIEIPNMGTIEAAVPAPILGPVRVEIRASSVLAPQGSNRYDARNLIDGSLTKAWAEGESNTGIGQTIDFHFERTVVLSSMSIWNGYQKNKSSYTNNGRITALLVKSVAMGRAQPVSQNYTIADKWGKQQVVFQEELTTNKLTLQIQGAKSGKKWKDTLISEIKLYGPNGEIILQ